MLIIKVHAITIGENEGLEFDMVVLLNYGKAQKETSTVYDNWSSKTHLVLAHGQFWTGIEVTCSACLASFPWLWGLWCLNRNSENLCVLLFFPKRKTQECTFCMFWVSNIPVEVFWPLGNFTKAFHFVFLFFFLMFDRTVGLCIKK